MPTEERTMERSLWGGIWPPCPRCGGAVLFLSDYGHEGAPIIVKAWACMNESCVDHDEFIKRLGSLSPQHLLHVEHGIKAALDLR